jgi:hypothetical protein
VKRLLPQTTIKRRMGSRIVGKAIHHENAFPDWCVIITAAKQEIHPTTGGFLFATGDREENRRKITYLYENTVFAINDEISQICENPNPWERIDARLWQCCETGEVAHLLLSKNRTLGRRYSFYPRNSERFELPGTLPGLSWLATGDAVCT